MSLDTVNERIADRVAGVKQHAEKLAAKPSLQRALVTGVNANGTLELELEDGTLVPELEALVEHVIEVGRELIVGMTGDAPEILTADLIAARTIIAEQLAVLFTLTVGQALESATYISGTDGVGFHIGDDYVEINTAVIIRGMLSMLEGRNILVNGDFDQDVSDWTAGTGALSHDAVNGDGTPGCASHVTPASSAETYIESDYHAIDRDVPYRLKGRLKPDSATALYRVALRYFDAANAFIAEVTGPTLSGPVVYSDIECYAESPDSTAGESLYFPNADVLELLVDTVPVTANAYTRIDEGGVDTSDYIVPQFSGLAGFYSCSVSILTTSLDSKTPLALIVRYHVDRGAGFANQEVTPALRIGSGVPYVKDAVSVGAVWPASELIEVVWDANPATGLPWTESELEAFRSGGTNSVGFYVYTDDVGQTVGVVKIDARVQWLSGSVPSKVKARLYTDPPSAVARTTKWDSFTLRPQPVQHSGLVVADRIRMWGSIEPLDQGAATLSNPSVGAAWEVIGSAQTVWNPAPAARRRCNVRARFFGHTFWSAFASDQVVESRVGISFDGGATWDYGYSPNIGVPANQDSAVGAAHALKGLPTGAVQVRVESQVAAGYSTDVSVDGSIDWTLQPADPA